uniref:Putative autotransporter n=1 Tax=Ornithodoros turicata TaxID=34597 RepID=A0A2R5LML2_9ACAR
MTTFTPEEIEQIKSKGNEYCKYVWLGLYDSRCPMEPDSRDEQRTRDLMIQKYERKRWYVDPEVALHKMQQEQSTAQTPIQPGTPTGVPADTKPLTSLLGKNSLPLVVHRSQPSTPSSATWPTPISSAATMPTNQTTFKSNVDIFSAFGNDPFSSNSVGSTPTVPAKVAPFSANGNFANFESAFNRTATSEQSVAPSNNNVCNGCNNTAGDSGFVASFPPLTRPPGPVSAPVATTTPAAGEPTSGATQIKVPPADRYAALADLDNLFHQEAAMTSPQTPPQPPPVSYGPAVPTVGPVFGGVPPSNPFASATTTMPWGMSGVPSQPAAAPAVFSNPFEAMGAPPPPSAVPSNMGGPFGGGMDGATPPPPQGGVFGAAPNLHVQQQAFVTPQMNNVTSPPNGVVPSVMPKDGYGGWGNQGSPWGASQTLPPPGKAAQQFGGWHLQQAVTSPANPFLNAQMPRTNSSNPFL